MDSFAEHEKRVDLKQLKTNLVNAVCASMIAEPRFDSKEGDGGDANSGARLVLRLVEQIVTVDPEFILKLAVYVRNDLNIRSTANFLVALAANYKESSPYLKKYFKHVINLPSDWLDVAALYQMLPNRGLAGRALPTALRKAMKHKFLDFDTYQLGKYNKQGKLKRSKQKAKKAGAAAPPKQESGKTTLTLKQMVRQLHIDAPVFHVMCLLGKKYPANETDFRRSGLPGVFEPAKAGTRMKLPVPETWETLLSAKGNKAETWEELIDHKKLPFMAMLRNLRNMILTGVDYKYHRWAMNKLNNEETIARSKQFPFRFFSAYEAIAVDIEKLKQEIKEAKASGVKAGQKAPVKAKKGAKPARGAKPGEKGERQKKVIVPKNMPDEGLIRKYREALDNAVKFATVHNVKPIRGNTVVFCSMADSMTNGCKAAKGMGSVRTLLDVGVLLGLMCKYMCEECDFRIVGAPGTHSKSHLAVDLQEGTVLDNMRTVLEKTHSGELSSSSFEFPFDYLEECIRSRKVIDNLIVLNDTMLYPENDERLSGILKKYRQEVNPELMFVSVNLGSAGKSMEATGADRHPNDVLISGFSDAILRYIAERGDSNQLHYIDHIDKEKGIANPAVKPRELKRGFGSSSYSNPFRSRVRAKPFSLGARKSFLWDDEENEAEQKAARDEEARRKRAEEEAEEREVEERERKRVAEQMEKVKSGKWRAVRIFVSSTFRDMHGERDYLVRQVFPELRERCRKRRLHFYDVDLRWGVTQEEAETEGALHICLNEIDRCRPFFVGLLGERYGWRPASYVLPEEPRYLWTKKYPEDRSITELEMVYGALRCPEASESFFYFRDPAFVNSIQDEAVRSDFLAEDKHAQDRLGALKQEIKSVFRERSRHYSCDWAGVVGGKPMVNNLEKFGRAVLTDLWQAICRTFPEDLSVEVGTDESRLRVSRECHEEYAIVRTRAFVGREDLVKTMTKFVDGDEPGPLVVTGESGSGVSSLIAHFSRLYSDKNTEAIVIVHFAGAANEARDLRHALYRIALELKERLQLSEDIPEDEKELRQAFGSVLESAGFAAGGRKVILLIDGLNQMEVKGKAQALDWLPGSTRVRMVVSAHAESASHHALRHRKPQPPEITVGPLEENHRKSLVRAVLAEYRKKLDESPGNNQMRMLLRKTEAHKPLYLMLACEELRLFGVYEQLSNRIKSLGSTVPKLFDELLHRLEGDHDKEILKLTLSILVASRSGMLEMELLSILAREKKKETELPRAVWAPIFAALQPFFRPIGPAGDDVLAFFHAQMDVSVRKRYFSMKNNELKIHKQLANHFLQRARVASPTGGWQWVDDRRAISELPHHLIKAQMWEDLDTVLCDLAFVRLKCSLGMAFDLLNDYNEAMATEHVWEGKGKLAEFQAFFAGNAHILSKYPELTLQQAANQPDESAPAQSSQSLIGSSRNKGLWVRWLNKPQGQGACKLTLASERDPVLACAFSPSGEELVLASRDGTLRICDAATGAERATLLGHTNWVVACAYSYDGGRIVSASWDGTLKIWDTRAGVETATLRGHSRRVNACAYSNDGRLIASGSWDCTVRVWDGYSGQLLKTFNGHTKPVNAIAFSPDGTQLVSASWDSTIKLWDVEKGTTVRTFAGHEKSVRSVQFSPTGAQIVSTSVDTTVRVWDARTGDLVTTLAGHSQAVNACAFSPDGRHLVSASDDQTVKVWDALGGREITKLGQPGTSMNACDISPDGRRIVAALADCTAVVWDVLSGEQQFVLNGHTRTVNAVIFSPGGTYLATAADDSSVRLWSSRDGSLVRILTGHRDCVNDICFSPDGTQLLSASDDFTLRIWDVESGEMKKEITGHTNRVTGCAWSPDGKRLASASRDNTLRVWSSETGDIKKIFKGHMDWLSRCAFAPGGKKVVSCSWDFNMKLWDVRAGNEIATLRGHMGAVSAAAFSADGKYLVSASLDGTLKIWDPVKALEVTTLRDHAGRVSSVRFASKGTTFVSCSEDGTVRLWDAEAGQEITTLQGHSDAIRQVKYCPDKNQVVSASDDCTVKVWNAGAQREIAGHSQWVTACSLAANARVLATASRDGTVNLWDTRNHRLRTAITGHDAPVNGVAISPDGSLVVSASDDFSLKVWDAKTGDMLRTMRHHTNSVRWVCFSPNGAKVASAAWDNSVCISDPNKGSLLVTLRGHRDWVNACAFSPDGSRIATASHDQTVILWDSTTGTRIHTFSGQHENWVVALAFSPDSKYLASASYDATVVLTDVNKRTTRAFRPHAKRVSALAFTTDGSHLLSASHDGSIMAHAVSDVLAVSHPEPAARFFTKAPATALCTSSSSSAAAAGDSLGNVYQIAFEL